MEKFKDSHGVTVNIGDTIVYHHSNTRGNTSLNKSEIVGFTSKGSPKVFKPSWAWDTPDQRWVQGAKTVPITVIVALKCNFAKGHKNE